MVKRKQSMPSLFDWNQVEQSSSQPETQTESVESQVESVESQPAVSAHVILQDWELDRPPLESYTTEDQDLSSTEPWGTTESWDASHPQAPSYDLRDYMHDLESDDGYAQWKARELERWGPRPAGSLPSAHWPPLPFSQRWTRAR